MPKVSREREAPNLDNPRAKPLLAPRGKRGPPKQYSAAIAERIIELMSVGWTIKAICRLPEMPDEYTVRRWALDSQNPFSEIYRIALELRAHHWVDEMIEIADDATNDWMQRNHPDNPGWKVNMDHIMRSRTRIDTRKWLAAKALPRIYGEQMTVSGDPNAPLTTSVTNYIDFSGLSRDERSIIKDLLIRRLEASEARAEEPEET